MSQLFIVILSLSCVSQVYAFNLSSDKRVRAYEGDFDDLGSVDDMTIREDKAVEVRQLKKTDLGAQLSARLKDSLVRRLYIGPSTYVGHKMAMLSVHGELEDEIQRLIRMLDAKKSFEHQYNTSVNICPEAYELLDKISDIDAKSLRPALKNYQGASRVNICDVDRNDDKGIQVSLTEADFMKQPAVAGVPTEGEDKAAGLVLPD